MALAAESDVDGDGYSDLVTLRPNGIGYVYPGGTGTSKLQFGSGVQSFVSEGEGTLSPSTFDGKGHLPIDVADVTGEGRDDLVTVAGDGKVHVFPGETNRTFGTGVVSDLHFVRAYAAYRTVAAGKLVDEPIAVADVDGDGNADLVARNSHTLDIEIYAGNANGTFDAAVANVEDAVYSALGGAWGENFIDVADVTGDGKADLVSLPVWQDVAVRPGKVDGAGNPAFGAAVGSASTAGAIDPALEDGIGYEPFGVGDVSGDGKADLVLGKDNLSYTYLGEAGGTFSAPVKSFEPGNMISGTFGATGFEVAGVLDVDGNGRGELVYAGPGGNVNAAEGKSNGSFNGVAQGSFSGTFKSTRHAKNQDANGNEIVTEKPISRRWGCQVDGCRAQAADRNLRRLFALENENLDIDGQDDERVDVNIAIFDAGVDLHHPDLNVVDGVDCTVATAGNQHACESDSPDDGDQAPAVVEGKEVYGATHGTGAAIAAAALDNGLGDVGVAPGARIWSVETIPVERFQELKEARELEEELGEPLTAEQKVEWPIDAFLGAVKWVILTREDEDPSNDIDVVKTAVGDACPPIDRDRIICPGGINGTTSKAIEAAVSKAVDLGIVFSGVSGNWSENLAGFHLYNEKGEKNYLIASSSTETDGLPGGFGPADGRCGGVFSDGNPDAPDDQRHPSSGWGVGVDFATPGNCSSNSGPFAVGAVAAAVSSRDPDSRADVDAIRTDIVESGNSNWTDDSKDGLHEPLLDVRNEAVFDPETVPGCERAGVPEVRSDVDGDGRSDLVTLRASGVLYAHPGGSDAKFGSGVASFGGAAYIDPAQYDDEGDHVVDVADVNADGCADLITLNSDGSAYVYPGRPDLTFGFGVKAGEGFEPALLQPGGDEPIAAADVNGDRRADLLTYDDQTRKAMVYLGRTNLTFGAGIDGRTAIASALHTGAGHNFMGIADVTGDGRADLISQHVSGDLRVFPGQADGSFANAVVSHAGAIEPAMDDGQGYEPIDAADVTGDGKADLVLVKAGVVYVYPGQASGGLGSALVSFSGGSATSTTFQSGALELAGLIDVDGDGFSDLIALNSLNGKMIVSEGQSSGEFATTVSTTGPFPSTQHEANQGGSGNEFAIEKPSWRRRGCEPGGCGFDGTDTIGIFRPSSSTWNLRNANSAGAADLSFANNLGTASSIPLTGDWDGDGDESVGFYVPVVGSWNEGEGVFHLRNTNTTGAAEISFAYTWANPGEIPVVGDWDGNGIDTIGLYQPVVGSWNEGEGVFHLRNTNSAGSADYSFKYTLEDPGEIPVVGDWDGNGIETIGLYQPAKETWSLRNTNSAGAADSSFKYTVSDPAELPRTGDWDGDGDDTIGLYRPSTGQWHLRNTNSAGAADLTFTYSWGGTDIPVVGDWDGA